MMMRAGNINRPGLYRHILIIMLKRFLDHSLILRSALRIKFDIVRTFLYFLFTIFAIQSAHFCFHHLTLLLLILLL